MFGSNFKARIIKLEYYTTDSCLCRNDKPRKTTFMCYITKLTRTAAELQKRFKAEMVVKDQYKMNSQISGFDFGKTPIITDSKSDLIQHFNWGLIPSFAQNEEIRSFTLNAKIETLSEKSSFRESVNKRCLVLANGFYEWKWHDTKGRNKEKFLIGLKNEELFAFAGIYSSWLNPYTNETTNSFSIVTTEADSLMAEIHNIKKRMPVVLSRENERDWLNGMELGHFVKPEIPLVAISQEPQTSLF